MMTSSGRKVNSSKYFRLSGGCRDDGTYMPLYTVYNSASVIAYGGAGSVSAGLLQTTRKSHVIGECFSPSPFFGLSLPCSLRCSNHFISRCHGMWLDSGRQRSHVIVFSHSTCLNMNLVMFFFFFFNNFDLIFSQTKGFPRICISKF